MKEGVGIVSVGTDHTKPQNPPETTDGQPTEQKPKPKGGTQPRRDEEIPYVTVRLTVIFAENFQPRMTLMLMPPSFFCFFFSDAK
jgi:hypothetical protein